MRAFGPCLLLSAVLWFAVAPVAAGEIYHPDAVSNAGALNNIPWVTTEARYHALVPTSALGGKPYLITDLAFATGAVGTFTATHCEITFAHLAGSGRLSTIFANNLQKDATVVFSGPISWACALDQWSPLGLTGTFKYNGVDQIVVEIRFYGGAGGVTSRSGLVNIAAATGAGAYNASNATPLLTKGAPKLRLTYSETLLALSGSPSPGGAIDLALSSSTDAGLGYQLGSSFGIGPIPIDNRQLELSADALLVLTVNGSLPAVFQGYAGTLDAQGQAKAKISIPLVPALKGVRIHSAFLTLSPAAPSGVANISNQAMFSIL